MKRFLFVAFCLLLVAGSFSQTVSSKLAAAFRQFENDPQLKHAISSLHVIDAKTGKVVFSKNARIGLAPASTEKIITAATAFELLGKDYRYKTEFGFNQSDMTIVVKSFGDPTFGSSRYKSTEPETILAPIIQKMNEKGIANAGMIQFDNTNFETQLIPNGWIFEDIGNYYGAGAGSFNWRENQFDLYLKSSSKIGDPVEIVSVNGNDKLSIPFVSELRSAAKGTGDNAYIYLPIGSKTYFVRGTIPVNENNFKISGAFYGAPGYFSAEIAKEFSIKKIGDSIDAFYTHYSPSLDSIIYWFLQKSINLDGEALVKTFAYEKNGFGSTDGGVEIVRDFWKQKGIDDDELKIADGSGLSPVNRVTTHAQVEVLKYAKKQDWFPFFYDALPEYNNMKMKSGTIRGVKGFCGYHRSKSGQEYIFSFLVNNYDGPHSSLVNKMYRVLNVLK